MDNTNEDAKSRIRLSLEIDPVPGSSRSSPSLSRSVQIQLGQRLRHFYEALALGETPVPDRFIDIINRLDERMMEKKPS